MGAGGAKAVVVEVEPEERRSAIPDIETLKTRNPTDSECEAIWNSLDFVISNLKFSEVHHTAVVDGTMENAWKQEKELLSDQIKIVDRFPQDNPGIIAQREELQAEWDENARQLEKCKDPREAKRRQGMLDMHTNFVTGLESTIPLLMKKCPNTKFVAKKD